MKRPIGLLVASAFVLVLHEALVRAMAHGHVAHVLLGAANAPPPLGAALLAIALVVVRLLAIVVVPGLVLAALTGLVAYHLSGSYSTGTSVAEGTGSSIGVRGTE